MYVSQLDVYARNFASHDNTRQGKREPVAQNRGTVKSTVARSVRKTERRMKADKLQMKM